VGNRNAKRALESLDIIRNGWSSTLDPRIPAADKERGITSHSKLIINACRPFSWINQFPQTTALEKVRGAGH